MDHRVLPNEMWLHIFDFAESPGDLARLLRTCRRFHGLAIRPLLRNIQWLDPSHTAQNLLNWEDTRYPLSIMSEVPRTLKISHHNGLAEDDIQHGHHPGNQPAVFNDQQSLFNVFPHPPPIHVINLGSSDAGQGNSGAHPFCKSSSLMGPRISSFIWLQELSFFDSSLPESVYRAIFELPNLRRLSIEYCTLPALIFTDNLLSAFHSLPITHLTLRCFSFIYNRYHSINLLTPYFLCTAASINTLKIDWTRKAAAFFSRTDSAINFEYALPQNLTDVEIRMAHDHLWPKQDNIARRIYTDALAIFLSGCPTITTLSITHKLHAFHIPSTALPNLTHFSGPLSAVQLLLDRPLVHVWITDVLRYHQPFMGAMEQLAEKRPELQSLGFLLPSWEDEVLHVISSKFLHLRALCINYVVNNPSDYTLLSLGHRFLCKSPELETVRIFKPILLREINQHIGQTRNLDREIYTLHDDNLGPGAGSEIDVKEYILTWKKPCPKVMEVQFEYRNVWKRCFDGSGWVKVPTQEGIPKITEAMELKWGMSS